MCLHRWELDERAGMALGGRCLLCGVVWAVAEVVPGRGETSFRLAFVPDPGVATREEVGRLVWERFRAAVGQSGAGRSRQARSRRSRGRRSRQA